MRPIHTTHPAHTDHHRGPGHGMRRRLLGAAAAAWLCTAAAAQPMKSQGGTIWRCGNTYSQFPCDDGKAVSPPPAASAQAARESQAQTDRIQRRADAMARERERQEDRAARQRPGVFAHPAGQQAESNLDRERLHRPRAPKRHAVGGDFTARGASEAPAGAKKKRKKPVD